MKKVVFVLLLVLGFSQVSRAQSWAWLQDGVITGCTGGSSSCDFGTAQGVISTTAGSVWVVYIHTPNNVTITSVSGGGGAWTLCPASSCHVFNAGISANVDMAYNLTGSAGTTHITVNLSGSAGAFFGGNFVEIKPPAGSTASYDASGAIGSSSCITCTGVGLTLTATDAVIQMLGGNSAASWNSWSSPYFGDIAGNGINLGATSGTAPTVIVQSPLGGDITALAFKSTAGSFTPPSAQFSIVNYTNPTGVSCSPSCSLSVPSTGSGNLLYVEAGNQSSNRISSISGGGTWVIPSGANTCQITLSGGHALSCAYVLSSLSGATSLSVTMTGSCNCSFTVWEIATTSGSFALDAQGSTTNSASFFPRGQALTLTGSNDVIFQAIFQPGGSSGVTLYPYANGSIDFFNTNAGVVARLNTTDGTAPTYTNQQNNATAVSGVAFKTSGTGTAPAPPTGLAAVVH